MTRDQRMRVRQTPQEWRTVYTIFMSSDAWFKKRARIHTRAGHVCESCLRAPSVQVHHVVYPQPLTLESLEHQPCFQLRAVCAPCHERIHGHPIARDTALSRARTVWGK